MKTDREWVDSIGNRNHRQKLVNHPEAFREFVKLIQQDCLREAAEILDAGLNRGTREHILIARDAILAKAKEISP